MRIDTPRARLDLQAHELATLRQACRTRLDCLDGVAWVTLDGDTRDIVLARGESFVVDSGADVVISSLTSGTVVDVLPPGRAVRCAPRAAAPRRETSLARAWRRLVARPALEGWLGGAAAPGAAR